MSTTVDNRVVEMRFDNKQFESNVATTMSTLDKLKQKLNFNGASKGIDSINTATKNVNMNGLANSVENVRMRFSALEVMGVTALANITNSAVNAGKRIVSALTIDPIKTGFQEYETQINAVQTILANTESKGTTINDVNKALDTLNAYADKTIYNFTEMTRNIGTFTAAGVDLNTSVNAIQGIANLAAVSGSTSQQASTAMYQLSQALSSGTVKLMDWNSVVNAGMGGQVFQDALKETARVHGVAIDSMIKEQGSFRETLSEGWLTSEILTETLQKFTLTTEGLTEAEIEANRQMLKAKGYTDEQIEGIFKLGDTATNAATKVKTFTQLWDVLKESAQSGWSQTWKLIVGDFEEAKSLLTPLADTLTGFINKMSDWRNNILRGALDFSTPWESITNKLEAAGLGKIQQVAETVENVTDKLSHFQEVVDAVWRGDYKNSDTGRFELLEAAGYDHRVVQDLVNKGQDYKLTIEDVEESHKKFGLTMEGTSETMEGTTEVMATLSDEQLKNAGLTQDEIDLYRALEKEAARTGKSVSELAKEMSENNGRDKLINSFKNIGSVLIDTAAIAKDAFADIFNPPSTGELAIRLYGLIDSFESFTEKLQLVDSETGELTETAKDLKRTFKGLFAAIDIVTTIAGGGFKIAFNVLKQILGYFNLDILDLTASLGDNIVKFRDWLDSVFDITPVIEFLAPIIEKIANKFRDIKEAISDVDFSSFTEAFSGLWSSIRSWYSGISEAGNIGQYILQGLANGITNGIPTAVSAIIQVASDIISAICSELGINSPSTVFIGIGGFLMAGLILGIMNGAPEVWETIKSVGAGCFDGIMGVISNFFTWIKTIDFGTLFGTGLSAGTLAIIWKMAGAIEALTSPFDGIGDTLEGTGEILSATAKVMRRASRGIGKILNSVSKVIKSFANVMNGVALKLKAQAIKDLATSLLIIVGAVAALAILNHLGVDLWGAVGIIATLALILVGLAWATSKLAASEATIGKDGAKIKGVNNSIIKIGIALLLVAVAIKKIADLEPEKFKQGLTGLLGAVLALVAVIAAFGLVSKYGSTTDIGQLGNMLLKMSIAFLLMAAVAKIVARMTWGEMGKAGVGIAAFVGVVALLMTITLIPGANMDAVGNMLLKISSAFLILSLVARIIAGMTWGEMGKAGAGLLGFIGVVALLMLVANINANSINDIGNMLLKVAGAFLILTVISKIISKMTWDEMAKAGAGLLGLVGVIALLTLICKISDVKDIGVTLIAISGAIAILAIVAKIIAGMTWDEMKTAAVGLVGLVGVVALLVLVAKMAGKDAPKIAATLLSLSAAIAILAIVAVGLGFIKTENLIKGVAAITILSGMMALMIVATRGASDCKNNLIIMAVAIGVMAAAVAALSFINPSKLASATIAMTLVMGMFALMSVAAGQAKGAIGNLITMTVAVGLMAGLLYLLATFTDTSKLMESAIALSSLMIALSVALAVVSLVGKSSVDAFAGVVLLTAMVIPLLAFVAVLALMQNIQKATQNAVLLCGMMTVLTLLLLPLSLVGLLIELAIPGIIALTAMAVPLLAFVGILALMQNIQNATQNVDLLVSLMTTLTKILVVLAIVGPLAVIGVAALSGLTMLMIGLGALAVGIGALMEKIPELQGFLDTGIAVLEQLAFGLGSIISSFGEGLTSGLPAIGENLSTFITNALPFITGIKMVDEAALVGAGCLAGAILALTGADLLANIASFLSGGSTLAQLGADLSAFMINAMPFIMLANQIDPAMPESVKALAGALVAITGASLLDNITSWLTGGSSLADFGTQLGQLATGLSAFVTNLGTFDEGQVSTVNCAANAIKALAEAGDSLPNEGGWAAKIFGENSLAAFGESLGALGTNLATFVTNLGTFDDNTVTTVTCAADAIKALATAADELPNEGGWAAKIFGDNSLSAFGDQLGPLGTNLAAFVTNLGTFDEATVETVTCAANAIKAMADAASSIDGQADWAAKIFGDNSLSAFGDELAALGTDLAAFAENLGTFGEDKVATVQSAVNAVKAFAALAETDLKGAKNNLGGFSDELPGFATDISDFVGDMPSVDDITPAIDGLNKIIDAIDDIADANSGALSTFATNLETLGSDAVDNFIGAFTSTTAKTDIKTAAQDLADEAISGIEVKESEIEDAAESAAEKAVDGLESQTSEAESAGEDFGDGLITGINSKKTAAYWAGYALGQSAVQGEKDGQASNSPSKLTMQAGEWIGEGLIIGMGNMFRQVYKTGSKLGRTATDTITTSVSKVADIFNTDLDTQPTIRPVVDLSNVRMGASAINDMLGNMGGSVGILANVGAINSMMNSRIQNGGNADVVSEIKKLRKDLDGVGNTTYSINGVTYDDGSNITNAVKTITRAAIRERRV